MSISQENQEKINVLFKTNPEMIEKLNRCDADAVREVGRLSQRGINPDDVIAACESGDPDTMNYLYQQAKRLIGMQELYKDLCFEYYMKLKDAPDTIDQANTHRRSI